MKLNKTLIPFLATSFLGTLIIIAADQPTRAPAPAPAPALAPGAGPGGGGGGGGGRGNFRGGGPGGGGPGGILDGQQWQLFRESMQKDGEKLRSLDEKFRAAQKELMQACLAATYDEKVVREKAEAVAKIQVEITVLRAQSVAVVAPTLKPEQKDQLIESRFAIMMLSPGGPGGFDPQQAGGGFGGRGFGGGPGGGRQGGGPPNGGQRGGGRQQQQQQ